MTNFPYECIYLEFDGREWIEKKLETIEIETEKEIEIRTGLFTLNEIRQICGYQPIKPCKPYPPKINTGIVRPPKGTKGKDA